ncbi:hypothetical protein BDV32DRAFT_132959 [Aspergillus pseudonomiae]|nr:hypothetical protein BDV32DRAFT_132959 [Aspergillus pseudonomiae]
MIVAFSILFYFNLISSFLRCWLLGTPIPLVIQTSLGVIGYHPACLHTLLVFKTSITE